MAIKDMTMTTETASDGTETVSEINAVITETAPDGTETVAEITTTAGDDPADIEGHVTLTETAPDGTETVTEIVVNEDGTFAVEEDESLVEEVIEAVFGVEIGDNSDDNTISSDGGFDNTEFEIVESESEYQTSSADFTFGDEMFAPTIAPFDAAEINVADAPLDSSFGIADTPYSAMPVSSAPFVSPFAADYSAANTDDAADSVDAETLERHAHTDAAVEAQAAADEFVASGDYAAAAEARETAENESWEAGDDSMLSAYDAADLTFAADKQEQAELYNEQQATYAQQGDYEAARTAADNSAYATYEADSTVGGDDHTGQADAEKYNMDWAVHEEKQADYYAQNAAAYAADGDFEKAETYAASSAEHQESADHFGDLGEHGGDTAVFDPSSVVQTGGTYESSYDSGVAAVDTGFDSGMDTSMNSGFDSDIDDV